MGTGPFDNDAAADCACRPDRAAGREAVLHGVLARTDDATGYLDEAQEAVAAAAPVAAQHPGGEPAAPGFGPKRPLPDLSRPATARRPGPRPGPRRPGRCGHELDGPTEWPGVARRAHPPARAPGSAADPLELVFKGAREVGQGRVGAPPGRRPGEICSVRGRCR
ncbi:DUF4259 domain-containing protein [Kitasatospora sp. DSM 101779]|uniref:DUF4259 domain-containing protein n=1 Tax=Kitasatospora sp. DSM 101779 TaxID=2853165 RepID=UPI0021DA8B78|nr:DUF4259 domain-containing protein [Kitasatospora sp. DSM 101779]